MRLALVLAVATGTVPAHAWQFSQTPVCTIWHTTDTAEMVVSYDPASTTPYRISVTLTEGAWPQTSPYAIQFDGPNRFMISTDRHRLSDDGSAVIAEDTGFGNVLRGLEGNLIAGARLGQTAVAIPLAGAAEAVARFRNCAAPGLS